MKSSKAQIPARGPPGSSLPIRRSAQHILDRRLLQRRISIHALDFGVLGFRLLQALEFDHGGAVVARLPQVAGRLADAAVAQRLRHRYRGFAFLQHRKNLRFAQLRRLYRTLVDGKSYRKTPLSAVYRTGELTVRNAFFPKFTGSKLSDGPRSS